MDGVNSSGFADQSVTNRSWADQIQDAHYALRLDMLQVISSFHAAQLSVHLYRTYYVTTPTTVSQAIKATPTAPTEAVL